MKPTHTDSNSADVVSRPRPNSLGIHQKQLESLLDRVDGARDDAQAPRRRRFVRWPFRQETLLMRISHPGGSVAAVKVACRNLSHGGVSILHSAFLYPGSRCAITVPHPAKGDLSVAGEVVRCNHLHRMIHEVGIRFDELVDAREFIPADLRDGKFAIEVLEPGDIFGHILVADAQAIDLRLIEHFLSSTRAAVSVTTSADEAADLASHGCDLAIIGLGLPGAPLDDAVGSIRRAAGHELPVIAVVDRSHSMDAQLRRARVNALLVKPLTEPALLRALGEFLIHANNSSHGQGGAAETDPNARLRVFLSELGDALPRLNETVVGNDAMGCYVLCQQVLGAAPSAGLKTLAHLADAASEQLATTMSLEASQRQVKALIDACQHAVNHAA
jgi:CheY-like chemotaxis protein